MDINYEITKHISVIGEGTQGWKREVNLVSWNGREPKLDIRDWNPDHTKMGKGLTLSEDSAVELMNTLIEYFANPGEDSDGESGEPEPEPQPEPQPEEKPKKKSKKKSAEPKPDGEEVPTPAGIPDDSEPDDYGAERVEALKKDLEKAGIPYQIVSTSTRSGYTEVIYYDENTKRYIMARVSGTPGNFTVDR